MLKKIVRLMNLEKFSEHAMPLYYAVANATILQ